MKSFSMLLSFILLAGFISCKKENNGTPSDNQQKKLTYTGTSDALSEGRYDIQVLQTGPYTAFTGGYILSPANTETSSSNTDVYNQQTGVWSRFGLSVKREKYAEAALNNKLVIAGGYTSNFTYSSVVDVFDLATGQVIATNLSQPRSALVAAGAGNKILFAGGALPNNKASNRVDIYNTQTGQWTIDSLSLARTNLAAGVVGNKIVFAGGIAINSSNGQGYYTNRVDIYDVQTGQWTQATLSQPRYNQGFMKIIAAGNKLLIAGGATTANYETVDVYDVPTNRWTTITLSGNTLFYQLACTNGSHIFLTSGTNYKYEKLNIYNVSNGELNTVPFPIHMRSSAMTVIENKVVIHAGVMNDTLTRKLFVYDMQTKVFDTTGFSLPKKKSRAAAAAAGNKILFAGGILDETPPGQPRRVTNFKTVSVFELK
jgi:Kelch motif/Galactose oxidase, central domain